MELLRYLGGLAAQTSGDLKHSWEDKDFPGVRYQTQKAKCIFLQTWCLAR